MRAFASVRTVILILAGIATAVLVCTAAVHLYGQLSAPLKEVAEVPREPAEQSLPPSLDCAFQDFTRTRAIVSFYFDVVLAKGEEPRFYERAIISADGKRTNFAGNGRPVWRYALDADGKPTITSQDGATRIVLYGLKLGAAGVFSLEAGVRSNEYRNLGGECRQTNLIQQQ